MAWANQRLPRESWLLQKEIRWLKKTRRISLKRQTGWRSDTSGTWLWKSTQINCVRNRPILYTRAASLDASKICLTGRTSLISLDKCGIRSWSRLKEMESIVLRVLNYFSKLLMMALKAPGTWVTGLTSQSTSKLSKAQRIRQRSTNASTRPFSR